MPTATIPPRDRFPKDKENKLSQAKGWCDKSVGLVFADYRGLTVKETQAFRAGLKAKGAEVHVLKNTLFRKAAPEVTESLPAEFHNGTTAYVFIFEDEAGCAKAVVDYATTNKKLIVKGGYFGGKPISAKQVEAISKLPPKEVLIAQVIGAIAAPLSNLVGVIEALYADPIRVIGAVADKVAEGSPVPAAKAEAAPVAETTEATSETPAEEPAPTQEETPAAEPAAEPETE